MFELEMKSVKTVPIYQGTGKHFNCRLYVMGERGVYVHGNIYAIDPSLTTHIGLFVGYVILTLVSPRVVQVEEYRNQDVQHVAAFQYEEQKLLEVERDFAEYKQNTRL